MGCQTDVVLGNNLAFSACTHDADSGALTDASAITYEVYEDDTASAILSGSMTKFNSKTGCYLTKIACTAANGFEVGKSYTVFIAATVNADTGGISYGFTVHSAYAMEATVLGQFSVTQGIIQAPAVSDNSALTVVRGDTRTITFTLGTAWPLTGKKVWFTVKTNRTDSTNVLAAECTVTDAVNGVATYTPAATDFATAGKYWYDVCTTETDGTLPQTAFIGPLTVTQDVKA